MERLYYKNERWRCSKCHGINPYRGIMNGTKGSYDEIAYRMMRYADKREIKFSLPFNYLEFVHDKRIDRKKFRQDLKNNVYDWKTGEQIRLSLQAVRGLIRR